MLLEIGSQIDILLRSGNWIRNMTLLAANQNMITVKTTQGSQVTYDTKWDIAVIVKSAVIAL